MLMLSRFKDEIIFAIGFTIAYSLLTSIKVTDVYGLWSSLIVLVSISVYYSATFFSSQRKTDKLYFFLVTMLLIIAYFAVVYKAFGIIDSTTNEKVSPTWKDAFYFSIVTWTTLGYGDFRPVDDLKPWVMVQAMMGYLYMGLFVGKLLVVFKQGTENTE